MEHAILVLNAGSSSIKFAVYRRSNKNTLDVLYRGEIDGIGQQGRFVIQKTSESVTTSGAFLLDEKISVIKHEDALLILFDWIEQHTSELQFIAAGHRVVHGGIDFSGPVIMDAKVETQLEKLIPLAPLHQPHHLAAIRTLHQLKPEMVQVACFDTAFHRSMPLVEQIYAIPRIFFKTGIRHYGFHGLSYEYIARVLPDYLDKAAQGRVIVAHLGHGASMCALKDGKSMATTMTFTPLDGLPMGTRSGSVDPAVVLYLQREKGMTVEAVSDLLHNQSGLLGMSGISSDMQELLASDHPHAVEAVELFVYRVARELGSLAAALGGLDALVFTAGIGEHAPSVRAKICHAATWLGVCLDEIANQRNESRITEANSPVSAWVIPTNEELIIAQQAYTLASARLDIEQPLADSH